MSRIYLSPPHMGSPERALLLDAFDSNWIAPLGPHVDAFEQETAERTGVGHAAALSSGTAAIHLALLHLGVGPGDTVLVPTLTFAATANAVTYVGAKPVFIDSELRTWNMDPVQVERALTEGKAQGKLPAAIIAVDLSGQCADYDGLLPLCERFGVPLIEDAAEALGATWQGRPAGSFGSCGVLSFNGNKIITTSGGGMLVSDDETLIQRARHLATQARDPAPHYQHSEVGYNYRMSNLLAAVGRGQLASLDQKIEARRENFRFYESLAQRTPGLTMMPTDPRGQSNRWLSCILIDESEFGCGPEELRCHLESHDIESRPLWKPMHMQPVFSDARRWGGEVAEDLFRRGLCLPSGSSLTREDRARIGALIKDRPR
ncbi:MAG: aminotransferase class I/II-fold pyridoxal phosphate-dependent enzyme [Myxococcota bacterium]|nr:aminotransferase class I/II-fold pyridoxal phosphate-dependent enzyme [Myxococcota bacterium]